MRSLGMNERPFIELPARGFPLWPKGEWRRLTTMTVSYGHGIAVTPLHLATAYAALVNGETPLHIAARNGSADVVKALLAAGAAEVDAWCVARADRRGIRARAAGEPSPCTGPMR